MRRESTPKQIEHWTRTLEELETFFKDRPLPDGPIRLSQCETVIDARIFVEASLATARANFGSPDFAPYVTRLVTFKKILISLNQTKKAA